MSQARVILFGDSMTQFAFASNMFGSILAHKLLRKCDVVNRGFAGYNSMHAKIVLPELLKEEKAESIAAITVFFGANDSVNKELNPHQHVSVEDYESNLEEMCQIIQKAGVAADKIILLAPPPVDGAWWFDNRVAAGSAPSAQDRHCSVVAEYAAAVIRVAKKYRTRSVDLYTIMTKDVDWRPYLCDGLHLSASGNAVVAEKVWQHLEVLTKDIPWMYATWDAIDNNDLKGTLFQCRVPPIME